MAFRYKHESSVPHRALMGQTGGRGRSSSPIAVGDGARSGAGRGGPRFSESVVLLLAQPANALVRSNGLLLTSRLSGTDLLDSLADSFEDCFLRIINRRDNVFRNLINKLCAPEWVSYVVVNYSNMF